MNPQGYAELVEHLSASCLDVSTVDDCRSLLTELDGLRSWVESRSIAVAQRLNQLASETPAIFPEQVVAEATRVSLTQALQPFKRVGAVELLPEFGAGLAAGAVTVEQLDMLARSVAGLDRATSDRLSERDAFLTHVAARTTSTQFARTLRDEIRRARRDDGIDRLEQQRRNTRLRTWIDHETGMWCLRGEFDPETGAVLHNRLHNAIEALFHDAAPETSPTDPIEKQHHLRALALAAITATTSNGRRHGTTADVTVLIDAKTFLDGCAHDETVIDIGAGLELPVETIRRMACHADFTPIIVGADGVHMELGQTTRLANREQRRALRAMYHGCAIPGCTVVWDYVTIHHITYFRNRGPTDIANLLPLCHKHHHLAHEGRWVLTLDAARRLTITRPDGTRTTTDPPQVLARSPARRRELVPC
ncbi:MAG TPA: DUF222 domain-containing protein [Ilumatobacteraceae bacterium]|jgi:hypothetical protein